MQANRFLTALGLSAAILLSATVGASAAVVVSLIDTSTQGAGNTAHVYAGTYNGTTPAGATWSSNPLVTPPPGNLSGVYQSPFNNTPLLGTQTYFSVGGEDSANNGAPSPVTLTLASALNSITLLWGSIDSYNTIAFYSGATLLEDFTGTDIINMFALGGSPANFEQVALLTFTVVPDDIARIVGGFDSIVFTSTQAAFEFALQGAVVPLPAAAWLLVSGLAILGAAARRRRR